MKYGQYLRLFISVDDDPADLNAVVAATSCTLHISATVEESSTKDTEGDWLDYEITGLSYDISADALVSTGVDDAQGLDDFMSMFEGGPYCAWYLATTTDTVGEKNREVDVQICEGKAVPTNLRIDAENRQNSTFSAQFSGYGELEVSA